MKIMEWIAGINFVDAVAGSMPWAGGLVPATMTYRNVQANLGYSQWEALIVAAVVEGIGFVAVTTALDMYEMGNELEGQHDEGALQTVDGQFWVAAITTLLYLVAVLCVNALLDGGDGLHVLTNGLLSIFGVMGGILVALRNQLGKQRAALEDARFRAKQDAMRAEELRRQREDEQIAYERKLHQEELDRRHELAKMRLEQKAATLDATHGAVATQSATLGATKDSQLRRCACGYEGNRFQISAHQRKCATHTAKKREMETTNE